MVVALLVEGSLPTPDVHGSNPVMIKFICSINCIEKTKIKKKEKEAGKGPIFKKITFVLVS